MSAIARTVTITTFFLLVIATQIFAQQREVWRSIVNGDEFGAHIPPDMIIINEDSGFPRLVLSTQDVRFDITIRPNSGKKDIALVSQSRKPDDESDTAFELGKVYGRVRQSERANRYATLINASSSKHIYFVAAYARTKNHPKVIRFLASLRLGGQSVLNVRDAVAEPTSDPAKIDDLKSSEIVREYLNKPVNKDAKVLYESLDPLVFQAFGVNGEPRIGDPDETRSLIILRVPKPEYSPSGGLRVSGTVSVQVTLLANGQVGKIVADPKLDRGLAESAASAAKKIKFIPTMKLGVAVDVRRTFVYNFMAR